MKGYSIVKLMNCNTGIQEVVQLLWVAAELLFHYCWTSCIYTKGKGVQKPLKGSCPPCLNQPTLGLPKPALTCRSQMFTSLEASPSGRFNTVLTLARQRWSPTWQVAGTHVIRVRWPITTRSLSTPQPKDGADISTMTSHPCMVKPVCVLCYCRNIHPTWVRFS